MGKKCILFFSICFLFCLAGKCSGQDTYSLYPRAEMVYDTFFTKYSVKDIPSISQLKFQKKPDGWHVTVASFNYDTLVKDELIWSAKSLSFQKINFPACLSPSENKANLESFKSQFENYSFSFFPYYNYTGFDWDIIQKYGEVNNLPDSLLYALGRSYSYFADNLLNNNSGFSDKRFRFKFSSDTAWLSPEQLAMYNKYHNLAVETFKKLKALNPEYETIIGSINVKLADEYVVGYLDMMQYQSEEEAYKELPDNIYDPFVISIAEDYLMSCDSNAILVVYGDNDTYPLLYVQAKYKFRTDVLIVNDQLIDVPRYIDRVRKQFAGAAGLPLTFSKDVYKEGTHDYVFIYPNPKTLLGSEPVGNLKTVLDFAISNEKANQIELENGDYANYIPLKNLNYL